MKTLKIGYMDNNCYVVNAPNSSKGIIIDPADDAEIIKERLEKRFLVPHAVLITHAHYDHIGAVAALQNLGAKVFMHKADEPIIKWSVETKGTRGFCVDHYVEDGEVLEFDNLRLKVIHTPGHSPGGVCYLTTNGKVFTGDTLFRESVGRGDLPLGNFEELKNSIKEKLFTLPDDHEVFPGHGKSTSIEHEKKFNPYLS
ncbi:MAG: MBL fold metallo-hydrolase [Firmicutes bacterium]|nr:MBL fold metallo-hydrolase [Bacillota bacterium]